MVVLRTIHLSILSHIAITLAYCVGRTGNFDWILLIIKVADDYEGSSCYTEPSGKSSVLGKCNGISLLFLQ